MVQTLSLDDKIELISYATGPVAVDTEVKPMAGLSVSIEGFNNGFYFPVNHAGLSNLSSIQRDKLYSSLDSRESLIFHNAAYDLGILHDAGFDYRGRFYDTMLMAHWVNEERFNYSLDTISKLYGGQPKEMSPTMKSLIAADGWDAVPYKMMEPYSAHDAFITRQLFHSLYPDFEKQGFDNGLWDVEQDFIREVMIPMMRRGIKLDVDFCAREYMKGTAIMEQCKKELKFDPGKATELKRVLIDELSLPVLARTKTGRIAFTKKEMATYEKMLESRNDPRATTILRYRGWQKATSSNYKAYINLADSEGVLHPSYKLHGTRTGRLSCEQPNLQQIPKSSNKEWNGGLKSAFIPRDGFNLWTIDYSQLQFRMACSYAGEDHLIDAFNDRKRDVFTEMAERLVWMRANVKTLVYLTLFGGGAGKAQESFNLDTLEEATGVVREFNTEIPLIKKLSYKAQNAAKRQGYVTYWTGRRRHFPRGSKFYRALNAAIQGGEAEIIKRAMIALVREVCDENCYLILQIHDEVVFEIKEGMEDKYLTNAQAVMERVPQDFCAFTGVPVEFHTSRGQWGEK